MGNCLLAYRNRRAEAVLSGGSWQPSLPLSNLQTEALSRAAVCTSVDPADTQFRGVLPQSRLIRVFGLIAHNLGTFDRYRLRLYADEVGADLLYDSGPVDAWPMVYTFGQIDWQHDSFWSLTITDEDRVGFPWDLTVVLPEALYVRSWHVEIFKGDGTPPEIGMLWLSDGWQPEYNASYGRNWGYVDPSEVDSAPLSGALYADELPKYRVEKFTLDRLSDAEAHERVLDIQRLVGRTQDVYYIHDPDDMLNKQRRWFLGRLESLDAITETLLAVNGTTYNVRERIE